MKRFALVVLIKLQRYKYLPVALIMAHAAAPSANAQYRTCGTRSTEACQAPDSLRFVTISAGRAHTCALTSEGIAWCWGDGRNGALGDGNRVVQRWPQLVNTTERFVEIGAGADFTCARTASGTVYCWGNERPIPGWPEVALTPALVRTSTRASSLAVGSRHACLLDEQGRAWCWGFNVDGETGTGVAGSDAPMVPVPQPVVGDYRFRSLSAGFGFTCGASMDPAILCWGSNVDGVVGAGAQERCADISFVGCSTHPVLVASPQEAITVSSGAGHACVATRDKRALCWGANSVGQAGTFDGRTRRIDTPTFVPLGPAQRVKSVHSGGIHSCAVTEEHTLYCWGADTWTLSDPDRYRDQLAPRQPLGRMAVIAVSAGQQHLCALDAAGRARCWGDTIFGAFGIR
jgi:alpha-tubulin suppressor-like RCC1 family protein